MGDDMSFNDISIEYSYDSSEESILTHFYLPVLKHAIQYDRLTAYFCSSALVLCAQGITGLIRNGGKMRLIASPYFKEKDIEILRNLNDDEKENYISSILISELNPTDEIFNNELTALAWMIANEYLEIRIALAMDQSGLLIEKEQIDKSAIFHQKTGILYDENGSWIVFNGSINETAAAWERNIEEFDVFRSWFEEEKKYGKKHISRFERMWNGLSYRTKVIDLPTAVKEHWIQISRPSFPIFDRLSIGLDDNYANCNVESEEKEYEENKKLKLYKIQEEARDAWFACGCRGILEMATGTGKTITSIACIEKLALEKAKLLVIVASPQNTISGQWNRESRWISKYFYQVCKIDGTNPKWKEELEKHLILMNLNSIEKLMIITSHTTLSSPEFIKLIEQNQGEYEVLLIGDEVHGLGAPKHSRGLLDIYNYRLGLSATPDRLYDVEGTEIIRNYFGDTVYKFDIGQAQTTINEKTGEPYLTTYEYHPVFVRLSSQEIDKYLHITDRIRKLCDSKDMEKVELKKQLLFKRAEIIKSASSKLEALSKIIDLLGGKEIKDTIIFTSPQQLNDVMRLLTQEKGINAKKYTEEEDERPLEEYAGLSEREHLIKMLSKKVINALVAIKCLDEGIDIPSARIAVLMASSTNPREYIQRIGRVIRRSKGKENAKIYDFIVSPKTNSPDIIIEDTATNIFEKEKKRALFLLEFAKNSMEALALLVEEGF